MHIDRLIFLSNFFLGNFSHLEIIDKPYIIYAFFPRIFFFTNYRYANIFSGNFSTIDNN